METLVPQPIADDPATRNKVAFGPLAEAGQVTAGLDYYKSTMSQLAYEQEPGAEATFTFKNRRPEQRLLDCIDPQALQERLNFLARRGFDQSEIDYYASLQHNQGERVFSDEYLEHIKGRQLPPVTVSYDQEADDLVVEANGPGHAWELNTFWETIVMGEVNEAYFEGYMRKEGLNPLDVYAEGDRRLTEKIETLKANPGIKFADFGNRRHFSLRWQKHVDGRLLNECPDSIVGISNVGLAKSFGVPPIGTYAHEMPMVYAGLADARGGDIRGSHNAFLEAWHERYGEELSITLPDTFGSDFFFADFTKRQTEDWRGWRHDSGGPFEFGDRLIGFFEEQGVNPLEKTIVFSDGLDIDTIVELYNYFEGRVGLSFGWGTTLTNDLGLKALNIVMKATHVKAPEGGEAYTVKLSDDAGKHCGPPELVEAYANDYFAVVEVDK